MAKIVIDTEAEITKLEKMLENLTDDKDKQSVRFAINLLRGCEKRKTGEWIPVSEQEPAVGGMYLVTGKNVSRGYIGIDIARRLSDDVWTFGGEELKGTEIIAWQFLPKPYKEDENEDSN